MTPADKPSPACTGCYDSFSGPWCDNCDQWPCKCLADPEPDAANDTEDTDGH